MKTLLPSILKQIKTMITVLLFFIAGSFLLFWALKPVVGGKKVEALIVASSIFAFFGILVALFIPKKFTTVKIGEHKIKSYKDGVAITNKGDSIFVDGTYTVSKDTIQTITVYQRVETNDLINLFSVQPLNNYYVVKIK